MKWARLKRSAAPVLATGLVAAAVGLAAMAPAHAPAGLPHDVAQGDAWGPEARADFYTRDQGSRLIPLAWARALRTPDGRPFLADLTRYGYLSDPRIDTGLPIGFTISGPQGGEVLGVTCAACHTRELDVGGQSYRVDGAPAVTDFQQFLSDLRDAVGRARATPDAFTAFAHAALGPDATPDQIGSLRIEADLWYARQNTLFTRALPAKGWGLGRLDAVSMIFDRLTGLDIGPAPSGLLPDNIYPADAPVRYPFIWNAPRQDRTQWPGFAPNGDDVLALVRNLGEVYGVFGAFAPRPDAHQLLGVDFLAGNSANFDGLTRLETLVRRLGPPRWPFPVDPARAARGAALFALPAAQGGCAKCHAARPGVPRMALQPTWATWLGDVGTDSREHLILGRTAKTGVLAGSGLPFDKAGESDSQFDLLFRSVAGTLMQQYTLLGVASASGSESLDAGAAQRIRSALPTSQQSLFAGFGAPPPSPAPYDGPYPYEARVLQGVWAAAPFLHNGSVASLAELLKPASERAESFRVGRAYDVTAVGLAATQPGLSATRRTTGCETRASGDSRCGHEFGTRLSAGQKLDLIEYMKTL